PQAQTTMTPPRRLRERVELLMAPLYARLVVLLGLLLLPVVIYSIIAAYGAYREGRTQSMETVRQLAELAAGQQQAQIDSARKLLTALARAGGGAAFVPQTPDRRAARARRLVRRP